MKIFENSDCSDLQYNNYLYIIYIYLYIILILILYLSSEHFNNSFDTDLDTRKSK